MVKDKHGKTVLKKKNERLTCSSKRIICFDYLEQLDNIGLTIILAYAYQSISYKSDSYLKLMQSRTNRFQLSFNGIIFTCCAQFVMLVFTIIIYSNRGSARPIKGAFIYSTYHRFDVIGFCCLYYYWSVFDYQLVDSD